MDPQLEKEIAADLKELLKWVRIQAMPSARSILESVLSETSQRKIYQALDGTVTQTQLARKFDVSQPTVSRLLAAWQGSAIVEELSGGKFSKLFDLKALGIPENIGGKDKNGR